MRIEASNMTVNMKGLQAKNSLSIHESSFGEFISEKLNSQSALNITYSEISENTAVKGSSTITLTGFPA